MIRAGPTLAARPQGRDEGCTAAQDGHYAIAELHHGVKGPGVGMEGLRCDRCSAAFLRAGRPLKAHL